MHNQKTIAKWMAIILLATVVVGCYILFTTLYNKNPQGVQGSANAGDNEPEQTPHAPVYSVFPRAPEDVDGTRVAHTGGEADERFYATLSIADKRYVFFSTESSEYDAREPGLYVAQFEKGELHFAKKLADAFERFIECKLTENGIMLLTGFNGGSRLRLLNSDCTVAASNDLPEYNSYKFYLYEKQLQLFVSDSKNVYSYAVMPSAAVSKSTYIYEAQDAEILGCERSGNVFLLTLSLQNSSSEIVTFDSYLGFKLKKRMLNAQLLQLSADYQNGKTTYYALSKYDGGALIVSCDENFNQTASAFIKDAASACMSVDNTEIKIVVPSGIYSFCKHLDLLSFKESDIIRGLSKDALTLRALNSGFDASGAFFLASSDGKTKLFSLSEENVVSLLFSADGLNSQPAVLPLHDTIELSFSTVSHSGFAYMSFGGSDVFHLSIGLK